MQMYSVLASYSLDTEFVAIATYFKCGTLNFFSYCKVKQLSRILCQLEESLLLVTHPFLLMAALDALHNLLKEQPPILQHVHLA